MANTVFYPPKAGINNPKSDASQWAVIDGFDSRYYGGVDIGLYADNIYLDQAVDFQFQVMEPKTPYYGYASHTWKRVVTGARMVQGSFSINFRETYYIYKLLKQIRSRKDVETGVSKPNAKTYRQIKQALKDNMTLEGFISSASGSSTPDSKLRTLHSIADAMESALWGDPSSSGLPSKPDEPLFSTGDLGFSLYVKYGDPLTPITRVPPFAGNPGVDPIAQPARKNNSFEPSVGTVHRLVDTHIMGFSQNCDSSGKPILETYIFIAQDIDRALLPTE
jgi:hypothetical protein